jgi:DsbC/DsbD-like thiol-disulfide interchange protein
MQRHAPMRVSFQRKIMSNATFLSRSLFQLIGIFLLGAALLSSVTDGILAAQGKDESYVKVTAKSGKVDKDGWQVITIKMEVDKDWHAYANPVQNPDLEPNKTLIKVTSAKKLEDVQVDYPKGNRETDGKDSYYVYKDSVEIQAKVKRAAGDSGPLEVTVKYVICNDKKGLCLPQDSVKLEVK